MTPQAERSDQCHQHDHKRIEDGLSALLRQTKWQARRGFDPNPPLLSVLRALVVLGAYGGVWLSVRGQHPYKGPSGWAVALAYVLVAIVIGATFTTTKRANAGVDGRTRRRMRASISVMLTAWIAVYVFMGALYHAGAGKAIVYGLYPATAPLMILGLVGAGPHGSTGGLARIRFGAGSGGRRHGQRVRGTGQRVAGHGNRAVRRAPRRGRRRGPAAACLTMRP